MSRHQRVTKDRRANDELEMLLTEKDQCRCGHPWYQHQFPLAGRTLVAACTRAGCDCSRFQCRK